MDQYWEYLRAKVCRKCIDSDGKGNCRLPMNDSCSLQTFFPEIVTIVTRLDLGSYDSYVQALRETICVQCEHQLKDGSCAKRTTLECALDRYYPLIIEVIETLKREQGELRRLAAIPSL